MHGSGDGSFIIKLRGLPFSTTEDDVTDFLTDVNILNGKEGIHLTEVRPGRPSGECFVEVCSQKDVDEALKKDKENMGKRYIEVFSTDRQDMEWALNAMKQNANGFDVLPNLSDDQGVVKLRGLPFGCSKEEVVQFFTGLRVAPNGVHLLSDSMGRASGEAFVHFVDKSSAQQALDKDREKIGHRYIEVFPSSAEEVRYYGEGGGRGGLGSGGRGGRMGGGGGGGGGGGYRTAPYDRGDRMPRRPPMNSRGGGLGGGLGGGYGGGYGGGGGGGGGFGYGGGPPGGFRRGGGGGGGHCVHMRGLPFKASPQDIAYFFKPIRLLNIDIAHDNSGRPSGEADVEFECHEDAMRAMRRDKNNMEHRYIELFLNSSPGGGGGGGYKTARNFRN